MNLIVTRCVLATRANSHAAGRPCATSSSLVSVAAMRSVGFRQLAALAAVVARLLVRREGIFREVELTGFEQPNHVDKGGEHPNRVRTPAEAEEIDDVATLVMGAQEAVRIEHIFV